MFDRLRERMESMCGCLFVFFGFFCYLIKVIKTSKNMVEEFFLCAWKHLCIGQYYLNKAGFKKFFSHLLLLPFFGYKILVNDSNAEAACFLMKTKTIAILKEI